MNALVILVTSTLNIILVYFRPDNINSCPYYRRDSGELVNSNTVTFGTSIAGLKNPIKIPFDSWPVSSRMLTRNRGSWSISL